jgi:hypothetical protein
VVNRRAWETDVLVACCLQVVNLAHLAHLIKNSTERFIKLELEWNKVYCRAHSCFFDLGPSLPGGCE